MMAGVIWDYCGKNGIAIQEQRRQLNELPDDLAAKIPIHNLAGSHNV
jgi:hypothetical protein